MLTLIRMLIISACAYNGYDALAQENPAGDTAPWSMVEDIVSTIELPDIPDRVFDIVAHGAAPVPSCCKAVSSCTSPREPRSCFRRMLNIICRS
jgi:hypothetical protein